METTHAHLAAELNEAGKPREAEEHYVSAGDWRGAVAAYRAANMWEDALRVAKQHAGDNAAQQVFITIFGRLFFIYGKNTENFNRD